MLENTVFHIKMPDIKTCNASVTLIPGLCALDCFSLLFLHSIATLIPLESITVIAYCITLITSSLDCLFYLSANIHALRKSHVYTSQENKSC